MYYVRRTKANLNNEPVIENITLVLAMFTFKIRICKYIDVMDLCATIHNGTFGVGINCIVMIFGCSTMS